MWDTIIFTTPSGSFSYLRLRVSSRLATAGSYYYIDNFIFRKFTTVNQSQAYSTDFSSAVMEGVNVNDNGQVWVPLNSTITSLGVTGTTDKKILVNCTEVDESWLQTDLDLEGGQRYLLRFSMEQATANKRLYLNILARMNGVWTQTETRSIIFTNTGDFMFNFRLPDGADGARFQLLRADAGNDYDGYNVPYTVDNFSVTHLDAVATRTILNCDGSSGNGGSNYYRYGFNGKENDNEVKGVGNSLDFGARIYDPRLGRWLSIDPDFKLYPNLSSYNFCANNSITNIDVDGKRIYFVPGLGYNPELRTPEDYVPGIEKNLSSYLAGYNTYSKTVVGSKPTASKSGLVARLPDMKFVVNFGQKPALSAEDDIRIANVANSIAQDIVGNPRNPGEQINLIGTSQGAVSIAQAAIFLVENPEKFGLDKNFKIDNLVLVGSPVDKGSALYAKLQDLEKQGKIGKLLYEDYQSKGKNGKYNDEVTGLAGRSKIQAVFRGIGFLFDALLVRGSKHPHLKAAADKPTEAGYNSFGEQLKSKLEKDGVH